MDIKTRAVPHSMADGARALLRGSDGVVRRFLSFKLDASDGVNIAPARGVPGLMHESGEHYAIEVPGVSGLHLSVHGNGRVHVRANEGGTIFDKAEYPPLRDLAAPTYVLEIHPATLASYPPVDAARLGDQVIDVASLEPSGFAVAVAVWGARTPGDPDRVAVPSIEWASGDVELRHSRHVIGRLEFQLAFLSVRGVRKPFNEIDEWWRLIHPPEPGDALPRPWEGTLRPHGWRAADE